MARHLSKNQKYRLTIFVLEGNNYSAAGREFGVVRQTAYDIANKYFYKVFPLTYEREKLGINFNDIDTLREAWRKVRH